MKKTQNKALRKFSRFNPKLFKNRSQRKYRNQNEE